MSSSESSSEENDFSDIFNHSTDEEKELDTSESEADASDEEDEAIGGFYGFEPEYSKKELAILSAKYKEDESSSSSDSERENDDLESSRLENLHWCTCRNCVIGTDFTLEECLCCKECSILEEKLEGISCITKHKDFKPFILTPSALEFTFITRRRHKKIFKRIKKIKNRQYRYTAYYQYTSWTHYFEILGRDKRVVIPSCVVKEIKNTFPESIGGKYTGFKRASLSN
ncbi:uncharacterized protein [Clytia hemisphaerica]|uniref:uncharacterized protein n=1 Tax=Clytia hemisphaerica TaxID=252671 RepID=UPI0034D43AED